MSDIETIRRRYARMNHGRKPVADCPQPESEFKPHRDDERFYRERPSRRVH